MALSVVNRTRRRAPRAPFTKAAALAAPGWDLSLVFVGPTEAKRLNLALRKKTYTPNVLSYAVGPRSGEILICPAVAKTQAAEFGLTAEDFLLLLFIHGCLHLNGASHGVTMERRERKLLALVARNASRDLSSHVTTHSHRHRHRHLPGEARRGRRGHG